MMGSAGTASAMPTGLDVMSENEKLPLSIDGGRTAV